MRRARVLVAVVAFGLSVPALAGCGRQETTVLLAPADLPLPTVPADALLAGRDLAVGRDASSADTGERPARDDAGQPTGGDLDALATTRAGTGEDDWRLLAGFQGTRWTTSGRGEVRVLAETVGVVDGVAVGLVRNEGDVAVGPVTVSAADTSVTALLPVLRPGEPAPFELKVGDRVTADDLDWSVEAPEATGAPARSVELATFWQRGVDDPRPAGTYLYPDDDGSHPMVVFGEAAAFGPVEGLEVVAAWIGDDGRLVGATSGVVDDRDLAAGDVTDFVVVEPGPSALDAARLMLWATGS